MTIPETCERLSKEFNANYTKAPTKELWSNMRYSLIEAGYRFNMKYDEMFYSYREDFWEFIACKDNEVVIFKNFKRPGLEDAPQIYTFWYSPIAKMEDIP